MPRIATIVLAAGASRRLGTPKQLLLWGKTTLIRRAANAAAGAVLGPVIVVLGAHAEDVSAELPGTVQSVFNEHWKDGIHTSIRRGVEEVERSHPEVQAVTLMTCDQPFISSEMLEAIANTYRTHNPPCVASVYAGIRGTPALFHRELFPKLKQLPNGGARHLIEELSDALVPCSFPMAEFDIDTRENYIDIVAMCRKNGE